MRLPARFLLLACLLLTVGCASRSPRPGLTPAENAELRQTLATLQLEHRISSIAVGILHEGQPIFQFESGASARSGYHLASVSKLVTAAAVLQLVDSGALRLDDPVSPILGQQLENTALPGEPITVRDLLAHTSGLRADANGEPLQVLPAGWNATYFNGNYTLLATVVERVSGQIFQNYLNDHVWQPLGITRALLQYPTDPRHLPIGAGQIYIPRHDMVLLAKGLTTPGLLLSPEMHDVFLHATVPGIKPPRHLGWASDYGTDGELIRLFHAGNDHFAGTILVYYPRENICYFILTGERYSPELFSRAEAAINKHLNLPPVPIIETRMVDMSELPGKYRNADGETINVTENNTRLSAKMPSGETLAIRTGRGLILPAYDEDLDEMLGSSLAQAAGDLLEFIHHEGAIKAVVWRDQCYFRTDSE